jgi:hypothetical protein
MEELHDRRGTLSIVRLLSDADPTVRVEAARLMSIVSVCACRCCCGCNWRG